VYGASLTGLTIAQLVEQTGVPDGTLRMWERRHGFPTPKRLPSGHRRYSETDVGLVRRVASERASGMSLAAAIARVRRLAETATPSIYAALRKRRPDLEPRTVSKPILVAMSHAIEDESLSRATRPLLFGSFQSERFYRQSQSRWRELSRGAELTVVFADFERLRTPRDGPAEIPVDRSHPLMREWAIVCCAPDHAVCLSAWEPPAGRGAPGSERVLESIWSVEPDVVWEAARICVGVAAARRPALVERARARLESDPGLPTSGQLRLATAITNRMLSYLSMRSLGPGPGERPSA
jgi:MerR family transcriptional regulator, light-induced transcriptional regulator